jgi:hypothetical protein
MIAIAADENAADLRRESGRRIERPAAAPCAGSVRPPVENDQAKRGRESAVKLRRSAGFYFRQLRPDGLLVGSERVRTTIEQPIQLSRG